MREQKKIKKIAGSTIKWIYLLIFFLVAMLPLLWLLMTSFKSHAEFMKYPLKLPAVWNFSNYAHAIETAKMHILLMNSLIVASCATVFNIIVTSMGAFAITREQFPLRNAISNIILLGVLMPIIAFMVPYLSLIRALKIYDTRLALILTYAAINLPISFFIIRSFMIGIPKELEEAAIIDGCSFSQRYSKIVLPLTISGLVTAGTLNFIYAWNEFVYALLLTSSTTVRTVQLGISFFTTQFRSDYPAMYAAIIITMIPSIIVYVFLHDKIIRGLTAGAVKG